MRSCRRRPLGAEPFEIARALAHGHVAAVLGTVRRLGLDKALPKGPGRRAKLILAMIVARIIEPAAKLATARQLSEATAAHSLGAVLGLGEVDEDELYAALEPIQVRAAVGPKLRAPQHGVSKLSKTAWISRVRFHCAARETEFCGRDWRVIMGADRGRTVGIRFADRGAPR